MAENFQTAAEKLIDEFGAFYDQAASKAGMSESAFDILYALVALGDGLTQKQLADDSWSSKQTINSAIKRLAEQGVVRLEPGKGRERHVVLTEAGARYAEEKIRPILAAEAEGADSLSTSEQAQLLALARKWRDGLRQAFESRNLL